MSATGTLPASTKHLPVHVHMYRYICTCSFDKAASTKAASTKLYQLLTSGCQLVSSGCQLVSSGCQLTVQRMSANFQNKAVSKYFWNMYQLMSAAVHVLRYVLSSGYQMRALHEFTNVSGSSADLDASDRNYSVERRLYLNEGSSQSLIPIQRGGAIIYRLWR